MTPQEFTNVLLGSITASSIASVAIGWLFRNWISARLRSSIQHEYDQKLEAHKSKLKYESDVVLERLRSELQIAAARRSVQYSRIYEKMLEVVSGTAEKLFELQVAVAHYTSIINNVPGPEMDANRVKVGEAYDAFNKYYSPRRHFIPKPTAVKISQFQERLHSTAFDFMFMVHQGHEKNHPKKDTWIEAYNFISKEMPALQEALEDDFRQLLGLAEEV